MSYCPRCGAEVEGFRKICPLCETSIPEEVRDPEDIILYPSEEEDRISYTFVSNKQKRINAFFILLTVLLAPALVLVFFDWNQSGETLTWSLYPLLSFALALSLFGLGLIFYRHFIILIGGWLSSIGVFLLVLEMLTVEKGWFLPLGLPIIGLTFFLFLTNFLVFKFSKRHGYHTLATLLSSLAVYALLMDLLFHRFWFSQFRTTWGIIVLLSLVPVAIYLYILHYVLRKPIDWQRIFHM